MKCLEQNCNNQVESKNGKRKFCSDKCKMKHFRKVGKKNTVTKVDVQVLFNEFKAAIQDFADKVKSGAVPTIPISTTLADEPLSFSKIGANLHTEQSLPSFQDLLNGMEGVVFADDKEEYAQTINSAIHLSEKQRKLLLGNLWAK